MSKIINWLKYILKIVPKYTKCVHASCWEGSNAQQRMMNILSPHFSDSKFKEYIKWMKGRKCDTAHVILMNGGDGEGAGYTVLDNPSLARKRIKALRLEGFAVVPWLITDDSSALAKQLFNDPTWWVRKFKDAGMFDHASYVVLGLEMNEYGGAFEWTHVQSAVKLYLKGMKIGVHHTSGKYTYASYGDIVMDQLEPSRATPETVKASISKIIGMGKKAVGFEYARHPSRELSQAALDAGAIGVGNW